MLSDPVEIQFLSLQPFPVYIASFGQCPSKWYLRHHHKRAQKTIETKIPQKLTSFTRLLIKRNSYEVSAPRARRPIAFPLRKSYTCEQVYMYATCPAISQTLRTVCTHTWMFHVLINPYVLYTCLCAAQELVFRSANLPSWYAVEIHLKLLLCRARIGFLPSCRAAG